jgi:hypothetical protein
LTDTIHPSRVVRRLSVRSSADASRAHTLDIFEHRLHPAPGFTLDDMVMTLIAMLDGLSRKTFYGVGNISNLASAALEHPYGRYDKGSVLCTDGIDANAELITVSEKEIQFPDGRSFVLDRFAPKPFGPHEAGQSQFARKDFLAKLEKEKILSILTGLMDRHLPRPYTFGYFPEDEKIVELVGARLPRLVTLERSDSGATASEVGHKSASDFVRDVDWMWICPPDRGWAPTTRVHGDTWPQVTEACDQSLLEAGRAIYAALKTQSVDDLSSHFAIHGDDKTLSNHERLRMRQIMNRIDEAIEDCVPIDMLKPAAAKRAQRRSQT